MFDAKSLRHIRNQIDLKSLACYLGIRMKVKDNQCWLVCPKCNRLKASFQKNQNLARCWKCNTRYNSIELVMAYFNINFREAVMFLMDQERQFPRGDKPWLGHYLSLSLTPQSIHQVNIDHNKGEVS